MGNLGRGEPRLVTVAEHADVQLTLRLAPPCTASYAATTDGTWPYSYDSCDTGTLPNQTDFSKQTEAIQNADGGPLSYLPRQRLSSCTCSGEEWVDRMHGDVREASVTDTA
jgi:hypothetical protein